LQPPDTQYVARPDGVHIAYQVIGDGPVDVVLAPGFVSHLDFLWADPGYVAFLRRITSFSRLVMFDKPGTGCSDPLPALSTLEERMRDIELVMEAASVARPVLFALSESGPTAVLLAATRPELLRGLVLYGSFARDSTADPHLTPDARRRAESFVAAIDVCVANWGRGHVVDVFAPSIASPVQRRLWAAFERAAASPGMARALIDSVTQVNVTTLLPLVTVPTLVLHKTDDAVPIEGGRELAEGIPGAVFKELPGRDHAFWFGDSAPLVDAIEEFATGGHAQRDPERILATVLFTDIVGSTDRAAEMGDARWRALIEQHDSMVREIVEQAGGRVVKSLGDGALSVFDGPARAIRCAEDLRDRLAEADLEIRAGVHTGECEAIGEDVGGIAVHIGARVAAKAAPGEVLVSSTVADLVVGSGLAFTSRGEHELKGVPGRWRLLAVGEAGPEPEELAPPGDTLRPMDRVTVGFARRLPRTARAATRLTRRQVREPAA
jgi:class 3 adenylate cyclase